ncbi:Methyltransferase-like protein 21B [Coemansia sp. RSA 486]|nr:Methyltransferase-like protein 21B [Coemansia sp. RSA 486]KAJ2234050.1 Methyltransferase-like protein 21B [Coemansia sp. RSA 485]
MELVKWKYSNPYVDRANEPTRLFVFGPHTIVVRQEPDHTIDLTQNTGFLVWDGAYLLSTFIFNHIDLHNKSCIELGAGSALVSITASLKQPLRAVATDMLEYQTFARRNISDNKAKVAVCELLWEDSKQCGLLGCFDVVLGSEILYLSSQHDNLLGTLHRLMHQTSVAYFLYKNRGLGEHLFIEKATSQGFVIKEMPQSLILPEFHSQQYHLLSIKKKIK